MTDICAAPVLQEAIIAAEEGGVMTIKQDSKLSKIRHRPEFRAIRVWLSKIMEEDELGILARLSVFPGSFNADGAAFVGEAPFQALAAMLEDMKDYAVLEAAVPLYSAPCSQPVVAGLLAPRYKMHSLIREVAQGILKERQGSCMQEAQLAFVEWMVQQARQLRDIIPGSDSGQSSPANAALLIVNEVVNFKQVHRALASSLHESITSSPQDRVFQELGLLAQDRVLRELRLLAYNLIIGGWHADAEVIARQSFIYHELRLGKEHPDTIASMSAIAVSLQHSGKLEEAAQMQKVLVEAQERVLGQEHPETLTNMGNFAVTLQELGKLEEAAQMQNLVVEALERVLGQEHPHTLTTMSSLAVTLLKLGKLEEAAQMQKVVVEAMERVLRQEHPYTLTAIGNLAMTLLDLGKLEEAAEVLKVVLEARERVLGQEHPSTIDTRAYLAAILFLRGIWLKQHSWGGRRWRPRSR